MTGKGYIYLLLAAAMLNMAAGCTKQDRENTIISQEERIDDYISSLADVEVVHNNGSNRVVVSPGSSTVAETGDSIYMRFAAYIFSNGPGTLFATNDTSIVDNNDFRETESLYGEIRLGTTDLVPGLEYGLEGVAEGEHCYIIFSAKYGFNNTVVGIVPKLSPLFFDIYVDRIVKNGGQN